MALSDGGRAMAGLLLRALTLLLLVASIIIIATAKIYGPFQDVEDPPNITFRDYHALQYALSAAVIGCSYTMLVIPFAAIDVARGRKSGRTGATVLLIFTDVVFAVLIATGAAAGLGLAAEIQRSLRHDGSDVYKFYALVDTACGFMLAAVVCTVALIMIPVHSLT